MIRHRRLPHWPFPFLFVTLLSLSTVAPAAAPDDAPAPPDSEESSDFIRFTEDDHGGGKLESAIATYKNADGVTVHLVAALHVAEKSYYRDLSKTFEGYDALLYEMVKPKGAHIPSPAEGAKPAGGIISMFQRFLKDVLKLEFQLDAIDYNAKNFVHADLDVETFYKLQEQRGESLVTLMLRSMLTEMQRAGQPGAAPPITLFDILAAMNSPDSSRQYKLLLARQFGDVESQIAALEGPDGTVILTERNKAALKVLRQSIADGKKNIGVFYGAAHMPGIEDVLVNDMGFHRTAVEWRLAWDMTAREPAPPPPAKTNPTPPDPR